MLKRTLALLLSLGFAATLISCSSSEVENEEADVAAAVDVEDGGDEFGDEAAGDEFGDEAAGDEFGDDADGEAEGEDLVAEEGAEALEDLESSEVAEGEEALEEGDSDLGDDDGTEEGFAEEEASPEAPSDEMIAEEEVPAESSPEEMEEDSSGLADEEMIGMDEPVQEKKLISVKKIKDMPYEKNGVLVNAVYVAREGDNLDSVSEKIFGRRNKEALLTPNPHLARGLKVGDKVYYNSPQRPGDSSKLLTFYEDAGLSPEVYVSQEGDNIRTVAERLLGHNRSWMEVYATNLAVDSKQEIPAGTSLRYWGAADIAASPTPPAPEETAMNDVPPPMDDVPPPPPAGDIPPPPPAQAMNDIPPPPSLDDVPPPPPSLDDVPPPPPAAASIEPPPPPPPAPPRPKKMMANSGNEAASPMDELMEDKEQVMMLGAGGILLIAGVLLFALIRKKRGRKEIEFNTATHTQIE